MRLIDIEAEVCADCICRDKCDRQAYCWAKEMQSVDAVPVVRCKDCKHSYEDLDGLCCSYGPSVDCVVSDFHFCANGERKDGDGDA